MNPWKFTLIQKGLLYEESSSWRFCDIVGRHVVLWLQQKLIYNIHICVIWKFWWRDRALFLQVCFSTSPTSTTGSQSDTQPIIHIYIVIDEPKFNQTIRGLNWCSVIYLSKIMMIGKLVISLQHLQFAPKLLCPRRAQTVCRMNNIASIIRKTIFRQQVLKDFVSKKPKNILCEWTYLFYSVN